MKTRDLTELAARNLREALLRNSLTTLGIAVGVASLVAMLSLGVGLQELANKKLSKSGLFDAVFVSSRTNQRGFGRPAQSETATREQVKILDDDGQEVPTGTSGRIFVGNGAQFEGYTGGGTKETIGGLMSSGDIGHFSGRRLFVDGRDDEMIVSGGENVFPGEVEDALAAHPDLLDAAVIGVPDDQYGQRLRSFVVVRPGGSLSEQDVKDYVRGRLARFKVPRDVVFVDELPRNPTGKVVKRMLDAR